MSNANEPKGFDSARKKAEEILGDKNKLKDLLDKGFKKAKDNSGKLGGFIGDLKALLGIVKATMNGEYKVSTKTLLYAVAALIYFVNPFDVVPDFLFGWGFIDDAAVIGFVVKKLKDELDKFRTVS